GFASRTNTLLSIPMLFFMGAASHLAMADPTGPGAKVGALILLAIVLAAAEVNALRSEEHTSELQSPCNLVCRLLLEKKKASQRSAERIGQLELQRRQEWLRSVSSETLRPSVLIAAKRFNSSRVEMGKRMLKVREHNA